MYPGWRSRRVSQASSSWARQRLTSSSSVSCRGAELATTLSPRPADIGDRPAVKVEQFAGDLLHVGPRHPAHPGDALLEEFDAVQQLLDADDPGQGQDGLEMAGQGAFVVSLRILQFRFGDRRAAQ